MKIIKVMLCVGMVGVVSVSARSDSALAGAGNNYEMTDKHLENLAGKLEEMRPDGTIQLMKVLTEFGKDISTQGLPADEALTEKFQTRLKQKLTTNKLPSDDLLIQNVREVLRETNSHQMAAVLNRCNINSKQITVKRLKVPEDWEFAYNEKAEKAMFKLYPADNKSLGQRNAATAIDALHNAYQRLAEKNAVDVN